MRRLAFACVAAACLAGVASAATITGTSRADRLTGTPRADLLDGRAGNDVLLGLPGRDLLLGGAGRDTLDAGPGDDRIAAHADRARDRVRCGAGRDVVTAELTDAVSADCEVVSRQISRDATTDPMGQHATQVEPDTFAFGSTVVAVYQVGRVARGGAVAIGFATSRDGGRTWRSGLLPGVTASSPQPGSPERASDPVVAYDAQHAVWLASTLAISPTSFQLLVSRSADGLRWSAPVSAVQGPASSLDKEWIACDNGRASPFRGRCYISYLEVLSGQLLTASSSDGGLTWGPPAATTPAPRGGLSVNGAQPLVQPDGALVVVYTSFADPRSGSGSEVLAARSTDGGASFGTPALVTPLAVAPIPAVRAFPLPSAEADGSGRLYVAWQGCAGEPCTDNRILFSSSPDGVTWSAPSAVAPAQADVEQFMPGLGADPGGAGATARLALVYHSVPEGCASTPSCPGIDVLLTTSSDGGRTWRRPQRLTAESMPLDWLPRTTSGLMLGDYVSTSFVRGRAVSVFAVAAQPVAGSFQEAIFAHRAG